MNSSSPKQQPIATESKESPERTKLTMLIKMDRISLQNNTIIKNATFFLSPEQFHEFVFFCLNKKATSFGEFSDTEMAYLFNWYHSFSDCQKPTPKPIAVKTSIIDYDQIHFIYTFSVIEGNLWPFNLPEHH